MVMVNINGREIGIDGYIQKKLDNALMLQKKNFDVMILIDGKERTGKSTFGLTCAQYMYPQMTQANIAIDTNDAVRKIEVLHNGSVIMIDEGSLMFSSKDAMTKEQKKLLKILHIVGQKNMIFIVCLPSFFDLNQDIATRRSRFLVHCYTDKNLERGRFSYYGTDKLKKLYQEGKKNFGSYSNPDPDFIGRFSDYHPDWYDQYLEIKSKTLMTALRADTPKQELELASPRTRRHIGQRDVLIEYLYNEKNMTQNEIEILLNKNGLPLDRAQISEILAKRRAYAADGGGNVVSPPAYY